jgi:hypothetical protein
MTALLFIYDDDDMIACVHMMTMMIGIRIEGESSIIPAREMIVYDDKLIRAKNSQADDAEHEHELVISSIDDDTHLFIFAGEPLDEPRHIFWNFVSSSAGNEIDVHSFTKFTPSINPSIAHSFSHRCVDSFV